MSIIDIENAGKKIFEQFPWVKRSAKRVYQCISVITSKEHFKSNGSIFRVSPYDHYEYLCGYYDKSPWDSTGRYIIALRVERAYKSVAPKSLGLVCLFDTHNRNALLEIGVTHAWNVQQGCMAQWLGPDFSSRIIYNDFREGNYCSVIFNINEMKEEKVLSLPIYDVSADGDYALSLDFSRLHRLRPGYGYSNTPDKTRKITCPDLTCIWKIDIPSGKIYELLKYTDFARYETNSTMLGAEHKVNHIMINPSSNRFMVIHRWIKYGRKYSRLVTVNIDTSEMYNLSDYKFVSHCYWKNDYEILSFLRKRNSGDHYYLLKDQTQDYKLLWSDLRTDGHCSYSPDRKHVITDTYPDRKRISSVILCNEININNDKHGESKQLARVYSSFRYDNNCRCDLHPRWSRDGKLVCFDSTHEGRRGIYIIEIENCI